MIHSSTSSETTAVILAAGLGTRMRSSLPKAAHQIANKPMLKHLIDSASSVFDHIVVVIGPDMDELQRIASPHPVVIQTERKGTAHAALQAIPYFKDGDVAILYADNPLISSQTMQNLLAVRNSNEGEIALLAMTPPDGGRYGRVIEKNGYVQNIVEWLDATEEERAIPLCNAGVLCAPGPKLAQWLKQIKNDNAKGEYYLGDVVALAVGEGKNVKAKVAPWQELQGINSRKELADAEMYLQSILRHKAMENGATLIAPETVFFSHDTLVGQDVIIHPHVIFGPGVIIKDNVEIKAFSHLEGCRIEGKAIIGPYARLRPDTIVEPHAHVGNFVELKATHLGEGAKVNHLTYLGNSSIGSHTNIGAGTITCNYDGIYKHRTEIGKNSFIGSNSIFVAPVTVGNGIITAAGSVITENIEDDAMAFGRARQTNKAGAAAAFRARQKKEHH